MRALIGYDNNSNLLIIIIYFNRKIFFDSATIKAPFKGLAALVLNSTLAIGIIVKLSLLMIFT